MFAAPRFVVIDDKQQHLNAILDAFQKLGSPCLGIHYDPAGEPDPTHFRGVRCLVADLHLLDSGASTNNKQHYALIASILVNCINPDGGPFMLVIWTQHPQHADELRQYLDGSIPADRPHARPVAIVALDKTSFINVESGEILSAAAATELRNQIEASIRATPQLQALVDWENDALNAAGATISAMLSLVPAADRTSERFAPALDLIMSRMAQQAVGEDHVATDPRGAIMAALAPMLSDRMINQRPTEESTNLWGQAVTRHSQPLPALSPEDSGTMNRMLHVALPGSEGMTSTSWGAVVEFPPDQWNDEGLQNLFGIGREQLLRDEFKLKAEDQPAVRPRLIRVGAPCDHAQNNPGPIPYMLALEIPAAVKRSAPPASEWKSPVITLTGLPPLRVHANCRFLTTRPAAQCNGLAVQYRLREQLLMKLLNHANSYLSRPGIIEM